MKIVDMFTYICRVCINICICTQFYMYKYLSHHHITKNFQLKQSAFDAIKEDEKFVLWS